MGRLLAQGRAPSERGQLSASEDARRGRNEPCTCGSGRKWKNGHQDSARVAMPRTAEKGSLRAETVPGTGL
jgi:uncharacterized protein